MRDEVARRQQERLVQELSMKYQRVLEIEGLLHQIGGEMRALLGSEPQDGRLSAEMNLLHLEGKLLDKEGRSIARDTKAIDAMLRQIQLGEVARTGKHLGANSRVGT